MTQPSDAQPAQPALLAQRRGESRPTPPADERSQPAAAPGAARNVPASSVGNVVAAISDSQEQDAAQPLFHQCVRI